MRKAFRLIVMAWLVASLPAAPDGVSSGMPSGPPPGATIEPTLPLTIDLHVAPAADPGRGEARGRLEMHLTAGPEIQELSLEIDLPDGVAADDPFAGAPPLALPRDARAAFMIPLSARGAGTFPIRVRASFRLESGATVTTEQAEPWRVGRRAGPGRSHAGAYEVMAVPLEELAR